MSQPDLLLEQPAATGMQLRPYQQDCVTAVMSGFKEFNSQLITVPTGGGKTVLFSHIVNQTPGKSCVLAHREELLNQAIDKIYKSVGIRCSLEKAESHAQLTDRVVVASVQTMMRRKEQWPKDHFDLVVIDECHHLPAESFRSVVNHFRPHAKLLGCTATPDRLAMKDARDIFENIAYEIGMVDLIKQGYLSNISILGVPLKIDISAARTVAGDLRDDDLGDAIEPYLPEIVAAIKKHASDRRILVFLPLIATSKKFEESCNALGLSCRHVDGYMDERSSVLSDFGAGKFQVLCNASLLGEGWDEPSVDCVIVLRPTRSRAYFSQMIGRGTRIHPGKKDLLLLDFLWLHQKHNLARPAHLFTDDDEAAEMMTQAAFERSEASSPDELMGMAVQQRESALAKELKRQENKTKTAVSVLELSVSLHQPGLFTFEPRVDWEGASPSDKQLDLISKFGMDPSTIKSKGQANRLISVLLERRKKGLASLRQIRWLKRFSHPNPDTVSFKSAAAFLDQKFGSRPKSKPETSTKFR